MARLPIEKISFTKVYQCYVEKVEKKDRTQSELDEVICWLTGYSDDYLKLIMNRNIDLETFFQEAPALNPARHLIKGTICGMRVEEIEDPMTQDIRYMDKLVDELAKGKTMEKILR